MTQFVAKVLLMSNLPEARTTDISKRVVHLLNGLGAATILKGQSSNLGAHIEIAPSMEFNITPDEVAATSLIVLLMETNSAKMTTEQEATRGWLLGAQLGCHQDNKFILVLHDSQTATVEKITTAILNHAFHNEAKRQAQ